MEIARIGVVGAGQMGNGIAHVAAAAGLSVVLTDVSKELVDRGRGRELRGEGEGVPGT
jgi:3-hydroxybutyryl-CoA dehydrogenase